MKIIDWLLTGDKVIQYLVYKYLLKLTYEHNNEGYIGKYLDLYDKENQEWGGGIYSPKWTSSTYTMLELKYMEVSFDHPYYQEALKKVLDGLWLNQGRVSKKKHQDMCVSAMLLNLVCYGKFKDNRINEIVDYILLHQMEDGGWNCAWDSFKSSKVSSINTTLSVLEAFATYEENGYSYRLDDIKQKLVLGQEYLLKRKLFKSLRTGNIIHPDMVSFHYPFRWKYDCFRALEYFARTFYPYDNRMEDALDLVRSNLKKGYINKGKSYIGKIHFPLEEGTKGRFNTFRGLLILKHFDNKTYQEIINTDFIYK